MKAFNSVPDVLFLITTKESHIMSQLFLFFCADQVFYNFLFFLSVPFLTLPYDKKVSIGVCFHFGPVSEPVQLFLSGCININFLSIEITSFQDQPNKQLFFCSKNGTVTVLRNLPFLELTVFHLQFFPRQVQTRLVHKQIKSFF